MDCSGSLDQPAPLVYVSTRLTDRDWRVPVADSLTVMVEHWLTLLRDGWWLYDPSLPGWDDRAVDGPDPLMV